MLVAAKYALFQVPGWLLVGFLGYHASAWLGLSGWVVVVAVLGFVLKDVVLFPYVRRAYELTARESSASLVGAWGRAEEPIAPQGYVRLGHELWKAELRAGAPDVARGATIRVVAVEGLTLRVEEAPEPTHSPIHQGVPTS